MNANPDCSQYVKETVDSGNFKMFIAKIFSNNDKITTLEEGRRFLETFFEEKFNPERDFIDYLLYKKDRHYEQYFEKVAEDFKRKKK